MNNCKLQLRSTLHVRPPPHYERDKPVALEALACGNAVVLHPPVIKNCETIAGNTLLSGQAVERQHLKSYTPRLDSHWRFNQWLH